jgi:Tol biopolymer transport system component
LTGKPDVSPDGRWIAFAGQTNQGQRYDQTKNVIWLLNPADGRYTTLDPKDPEQGRAPRWSPDGRTIAFESNRGNILGQYALFIQHRDGSGLRRITDYGLNGSHPAWSPDGKSIAFDAMDQPASRATHIAVLRLE